MSAKSKIMLKTVIFSAQQVHRKRIESHSPRAPAPRQLEYLGQKDYIKSNCVNFNHEERERRRLQQYTNNFLFLFLFMAKVNGGGGGRWGLNPRQRAPQRMPIQLG